MIQFIARKKRNPQNNETKYYAQMAPVTPLTLNGVAEQIERQCTVSMPDIKAVLNAMEYVVVSALKNGQSVRLGDLGSFRPTLTSSPADAASDVKAGLVKRVRCRYTQSGSMTRALDLKNLELQAYAAPAAEADGEETA